MNEGYPSHCCAKCLSDDPDVQMHKEEAFQKRYGDGIINPFQAREVIQQIDKTNLERYGVRRFTQTEQYREIVQSKQESINQQKYETHKKNRSFNQSKTELIVGYLIRQKYNGVISQYKSKEYPFACDFYIADISTYVEYNGTWTHGGHPFDQNCPDDQKKAEQWRSKGKKYYDMALYVWTDLDVRKRRCALDNNLKFIEMWNVQEVENWLGLSSSKIYYPFNRKKLDREFSYYKDKNANLMDSCVSHNNYIIKYFQQDMFFKKEKEIWFNDPEKREKLILNRVRYLEKDESELTSDDILTGFTKSGIYYGYSHFNPLWFKWFIKNYGIKSCYDPCGGWGHRLLGGLSLEKYIYNDLSATTKKNIDRIVDYFKIKNTVTYNEDALKFNPQEKFEAMFTCPPYFNTEHYECGDFKDRESFDVFLDSLFDVFHKHEECRIFGLAIRDDLLGNHVDYTDKFLINRKETSYFDDKDNANLEHIFVFTK